MQTQLSTSIAGATRLGSHPYRTSDWYVCQRCGIERKWNNNGSRKRPEMCFDCISVLKYENSKRRKRETREAD